MALEPSERLVITPGQYANGDALTMRVSRATANATVTNGAISAITVKVLSMKLSFFWNLGIKFS